MKRLMVTALVAATILSLGAQAGAQTPMTQEQRREAIRQLHWQRSGRVKLPISHSTLALPQGYLLVVGEDAQRLMALTGNRHVGNVEAVAFKPDTNDEIVFQSINEGYVRLNDWQDIDPASMMRSIRKNTEETNQWRRQQGFSELTVVGWVRKPTLNRATMTAFWATEDIEGGSDHVVNSTAVRLGRNGYEQVSWLADKTRYVPTGGQLALMLRAQSFDPGFRYIDHQPGDRIAAYTIAGLVAAVAGAKVLKVTAGIGLLLLLKKFAVLLLAVAAGVLYKVKNFFRRLIGRTESG